MNSSHPITFQRRRRAAPGPGVPVASRTLGLVFGLWTLAFALKHVGASWDLAWHFRFLRDDMIPPHILNLSGNALALALLYAQSRTGVAAEGRGLALMLAGLALFVVAVPLDVLNHRLFGLDVTIWSAPHLMFFGGSTLALLGLLRMWLRLAPSSRWKTAHTLIFLTLLMNGALFVLGQHEYGVLAVDAYLKGHPTASDDLLALAHGNVVGFATGYMAGWVYPVWLTLVGTAVLIGARRAQPGRWTATTVAALYLAYRGAAHALLSAAQFPPSFVPLMLLAAGCAVDLAARWRWHPGVTAAALLGAFYGGAALLGQVVLMPAFSPATALAVAAPLWALIAATRAPETG
jgi:hypothetical protein